jgi:hypothetical protein
MFKTMKKTKLIVAVMGIVLVSAVIVGQHLMASQATSPTQIPFQLISDSLVRSDDDGGSWLFEEGQFFNATDGTFVGSYMAVYRTFSGSNNTPNAATVEYTLFFSSFAEGDAPSSLHLRGASSFSSGNQSGSITARGGNVSLNIGDPFTYNGANGIMVVGQ